MSAKKIGPSSYEYKDHGIKWDDSGYWIIRNEEHVQVDKALSKKSAMLHVDFLMEGKLTKDEKAFAKEVRKWAHEHYGNEEGGGNWIVETLSDVDIVTMFHSLKHAKKWAKLRAEMEEEVKGW